MILYINACVRKNSRTNELALDLLKKLGGEFTERKLDALNLKPHSCESLIYEGEQIAQGNLNDKCFEYAREFAAADTIVIAAPFWDFSFPALLKTYIENIYTIGIVCKYGAQGVMGLCKAKKLYYVVTSGGNFDPRFSFDYIKELCTTQFGIPNVELIKAENLDIDGADVQKILDEAKGEIII